MSEWRPEFIGPNEASRPQREMVRIRHAGVTWEYYKGVVDLLRLPFSAGTQRHFSRLFVAGLKARFRADLVKISVAVFPDGRELCIDGHHCAVAAKELGYEQWPDCRFYPVNDEAEAAKLCRELLNQQPATSSDKFAIDLEADDPVAHSHLALLRRAGRDFSREKRTKERWNVFTSTGATMWVEKRVKAEGLIAQLQFANACWPDQPQVCSNEIVRAVFYLFRDWRTRSRKFPEQQVRDALFGTKLATLVAEAVRAPYRKMQSPEAKAQTIARVMAEYFNEQGKGFKLYHLSSMNPPPGPRSSEKAKGSNGS